MSLCKLALPFGLGYLAHPIWNPFDLLGFRPNIFLSIFAEVFALFLCCNQYTIGHLVKFWLFLCFTIFLDFNIHLISGLLSQEISKQLNCYSAHWFHLCVVSIRPTTLLSCSVQHFVEIQNSDKLWNFCCSSSAGY